MRFILASQSPRRKELLESTGLAFEIITEEAEELHDESIDPQALCEINAYNKARAVADKHADALVLGADTLVFLEGKPLGKPKDLAEAKETLRLLSGKTHSVCTGVSLCAPMGGRIFSVVTEVTFKELSEEAIDRYLALVHVLDKAGSYAYQEHGELIIDHIVGDEKNVIGLPVTRLWEVLQEQGWLAEPLEKAE